MGPLGDVPPVALAGVGVGEMDPLDDVPRVALAAVEAVGMDPLDDVLEVALVFSQLLVMASCLNLLLRERVQDPLAWCEWADVPVQQGPAWAHRHWWKSPRHVSTQRMYEMKRRAIVHYPLFHT